jgi:DNA-binding SARP family transcriptional activator
VLEFRIMGPLEVVGDRGPIELGGPKQRATLGILLLSANRVVSVERLADDLYAGAAPVTAVTQVQRQISSLRKALGSSSIIETRAPGYLIRLSPGQLDLDRFERWTEEAAQLLAQGDAQSAASRLHEALALWRGAPLADLAYESFAQITIGRLEEIRLAGLEMRIEADLALGRHSALVGELETLVREHPLHERLRAQLMLALYRAGRQADALDAYREAREVLVEQFGIEPSPALHVLERAILTHDPSLDLQENAPRRADSVVEPDRAVLVLPSADDRLSGLLTIAEPLARLPGRELIIARLLADAEELEATVSALNAGRSAIELPVRTAAFTTLEPSRDVVRLATTYDVELVLVDAPAGFDGSALPADLLAMLASSPADVAMLAGAVEDWRRGPGVFIPFGGGEHDWAALELGAWLASVTGAALRVVGTKADPRRARRDASRLLADASLAVQRVVRVEVEPVLAEPGVDGLVAAVAEATLVVAGFSPRWREEGIGAARRALVGEARSPVLLVHRGPRPGGLAPRGSRTRFSWSLES